MSSDPAAMDVDFLCCQEQLDEFKSLDEDRIEDKEQVDVIQFPPEIERQFDELDPLFMEEYRLDDRISELKKKLKGLTRYGKSEKLIYITNEAIASTPCFKDCTLFVIKGGPDKIRVPDPYEDPTPHYRLMAYDDTEPIDCYFVRKNDKERSGAANQGQDQAEKDGSLAESISPEDDSLTRELMADESLDNISSDDTVSEPDCDSGFVKLVLPAPRPLDDYWLQSNFEGSLTDYWRH